MIQGGCLCGKIRFEISAEIHDIVYCHCSQCRKAQGSAFAVNGNVDAEAFRFISGESELSAYQYRPEQKKFFCKHCGSPVMSRNENKPGVVRIRLGTLDADIPFHPQAHVFVGSKASWDHICDELPQFEEYPE